jgi:hypothetical protein
MFRSYHNSVLLLRFRQCLPIHFTKFALLPDASPIPSHLGLTSDNVTSSDGTETPKGDWFQGN